MTRILAGKNLLNTLSPNFDSLSELEHCDLSDNELEGLGEAFTSGAHVKLATLDLSRNKLERYVMKGTGILKLCQRRKYVFIWF